MDDKLRNQLAFEAVSAVERAWQAGRDEMARALADTLAGLGAEYDGSEYREGAEDMLNALMQAGANNPRKD